MLAKTMREFKANSVFFHKEALTKMLYMEASKSIFTLERRFFIN